MRANEVGRRKLRDMSETVRHAIEALTLVPDADGWAEFDVPIEEVGWASHEFGKLGNDVEGAGPAGPAGTDRGERGEDGAVVRVVE